VANPNPKQDKRSKTTGRFVRSPETAARDAEAARLYGDEGLTYQQIADHFGWATKNVAFDAVRRAYRDLAAPAKAARDRRTAELELLWETGLEILNNHHVVVNNGRIIELDGEPLRDDNPRIQVLGQLRQINESMRKLDGTDAPSRVSVEAEQLGRDILKLLDATLDPDDPGDDPDA
jgi:hypothetical protein